MRPSPPTSEAKAAGAGRKMLLPPSSASYSAISSFETNQAAPRVRLARCSVICGTRESFASRSPRIGLNVSDIAFRRFTLSPKGKEKGKTAIVRKVIK